jgi:hypothetical protein
MYAPGHASPVLTRAELPDLPTLVSHWLDDLETGRTDDPAEPLELGASSELPRAIPRRALMLMGSPRGDRSVSAAIAVHLAGQLSGRGLTVTTASILRHLRDDPGLGGLGERLGQADVVALATPLYVDSLPAPVTAALERLARVRQAAPSPRPRFLAMVNCGFPEAVHTDTALAICRRFAPEAGLDWIGGLGIGGGGMFEGKALAELGGRARNLTRALTLTADSIVQGGTIPAEAQRLARELTIPAWLYRLIGERGFRKEARKHGVRHELAARPYAP